MLLRAELARDFPAIPFHVCKTASAVVIGALSGDDTVDVSSTDANTPREVYWEYGFDIALI